MKREYHFVEGEIPPGVVTTTQLALVFRRPRPGTGIPGHPKTQLMAEYATEDTFQPNYIEFDESCRKAFRVVSCFVGQRAVWFEHTAQNVTAELLATRPVIQFPVLACGLNITMLVENVTDRSVRLIAKVVGEDLPNYNPERSTDDIMTREKAR